MRKKIIEEKMLNIRWPGLPEEKRTSNDVYQCSR
jgi:hypothetical protein